MGAIIPIPYHKGKSCHAGLTFRRDEFYGGYSVVVLCTLACEAERTVSNTVIHPIYRKLRVRFPVKGVIKIPRIKHFLMASWWNAYTTALEAVAARHEGSNPSEATIKCIIRYFKMAGRKASLIGLFLHLNTGASRLEKPK